MTSDAKIGLLLGLVFIFIIAFVINGLPGLHQKDDSNKLTTNMVGLESNPSGLGANERKVQLALDQSSTLQVESAQPAGNAAAATDARFAMQLPQGAPTGTDSSPVGIAAPAQPSVDSAPVATVQTQPAVSPAPAIQTPAPNAPVAKTQPATKPETVKSVAPKTYIVQQGDSLSLIAKKVYGEQQGNKLASVETIFEANRKTLASIDSLQVGQKLIIPPVVSSSNPPSTGSSASAPTSVLSGPAFSKVDSVGTKHLPAPTTKPVPSGVIKPAAASTPKPAPAAKPDNIYVVKEGDTLWRIASDRLGDGNRYKDIVKLNSSILASEDDLEVGMKLKLPAK